MRLDLTGKQFGFLTVLCLDHIGNGFRCHWLCICFCGKTSVVQSGNLVSGNTQSCGCRAHWKHGMSKDRTPEYLSWDHMIQRCTNPKNDGYEDYGGRGITVCERWRDFRLFLRDMGSRPKGTSLDRINNNGNYEPKNCRWATQSQQNFNRRKKREKTKKS